MLSSPSCVWMEEPAAPRVTMSARTLRELPLAPAGALLHHLPLILVHRHPRRLRHKAREVLSAEHRQLLTRVEYEGNARRRELRRMLDHALAPGGRDDTDGDVVRVADAILLRALHGAGVKRRDLVVVEVGGDERLRRELRFDHPDVVRRYAAVPEPLPVGAEVAPDGGHGAAIIPQEPQVIGDVAGAAAVFAAQLRHEK